MINLIVILLIYACIRHHKAIALELFEAQYSALYDLYNSTDGPNWTWLEPNTTYGYPWVFGPDANPCEDKWQGVLCSATPEGYNVVSLERYDYALNGPLPASIGNFPQLRFLYLGSGLTGTIPESVTKLTNLIAFNLGGNHMTGTLPRSLGNMSQLVTLDLYGNNFNGSIPESIGQLVNLTDVNLGYNILTGAIPNSISNLGLLSVLILENNHLDGSLPKNMGNMKSLTSFATYNNHLTGPIPHSICNLTLLIELHVQFNLLSSSIPPCIGNWVNLVYLGLEVNRLTGALPDSIGKMHRLLTLQVSSNYLTSTIPPSIGLLRNLAEFNLFHNGLVGSIPDSIWGLPQLMNLYLNRNHLTGELPQFNVSNPQLIHLNLSANHFHGTIPEQFDQFNELVVLSMSGNMLTGTIPASIGEMSLEVFQVGDNELTGTIPASIHQLTSLIVLSLKGNHLTGSLTEVFSAAQVNLITVQLDDNQFTGELPAVLFELPSLISLSIVGSCLHGTLPSNICNATSLEALVLYGLTTGASCRATGIQTLSIRENEFGGNFPECVLTLPRLRTLLLASNRLTGRLPDDARLNDSLVQLDLSHNRLTGSIPMGIQNRSWALLDLSHNRLDGSLSGDFFQPLNLTIHQQFVPTSDFLIALNITQPSTSGVHSVLALDTNRLSGRVPNHIKHLSDLSVLAGNLFQCRYDKSDLPQHDSDFSNYECASNQFDLSIYVWLGLTVVVPVLLWIAARYYKIVWARVHASFVVTVPDTFVDRTQNLFHVLQVYDRSLYIAKYCTLFCLCVLMPYYAVISQYEGTHTHQYAYVLSAIYTSGVLPFALDMVLLVVLMLVFVLTCRIMVQNIPFAEKVVTRQGSLTARGKVFGTYVILNITCVLGVNVAFVYTVLYQDTAVEITAQVLLSLFKLGWSTAVSPWMIRQLDNYFIPAREGEKESVAEPFFTLQLLVALFNNIAIPCLVVMAVDPNCFSEILSPTESTSVAFLLPVCVENLQKGVVCQEVYYQRASLSFTPPFTYSYQCSASFITYYSPTFVYMAIAIVFLNPILRYLMLRLHARLPRRSSAYKVLSALLPRILQALPPEPYQSTGKMERPFFRAVGPLVTLLTQICILLTFGAIFPPVALAMAVSIVATVYTARLELQRFVRTVVAAQRMYFLDKLDVECTGIGSKEQLRRATKVIACYSCAFYTLFLFDTLGDTQGFKSSVWVLIVVPLTPIVICYSHILHSILFTSKMSADKLPSENMSIEVRDSASSHNTKDAILIDTVNKIHEV